MTTTYLASFALAATLTTSLTADVPLPEPDLVYFGSLTVDGMLVESEDPAVSFRVRALLDGTEIAGYRMFSNDAAVLGAPPIPQYLLRVPMEFVTPAAGFPTNQAVQLGDEFSIVLERCTAGCDDAGAIWEVVTSTMTVAPERATVTQLDLPATSPCPTDLDGSGTVDFGDLLAILSSWGPCDACPADFNMSGTVDFNDLLAVLSSFGPCE
ncbi:MAG: hypothetical protein AB8G96_15735 [Phycisphaerales bacterium]